MIPQSEIQDLTDGLIEGFERRIILIDQRVDQLWRANNKDIQNLYNAQWEERQSLKRFMAEMSDKLLASQQQAVQDMAQQRALWEENDRKDREVRRKETDAHQETWQQLRSAQLQQLEARLTQRGLLLALLLVTLMTLALLFVRW